MKTWELGSFHQQIFFAEFKVNYLLRKYFIGLVSRVLAFKTF